MRLALLPLLVLGLASVGCGGGPKLVPVEGTILLNGEPLGDAKVTFMPDPSNDPSTPGSDVTGPDGSFMARYNGRFGLSPGRYKVLVSKEAELVTDNPHIDEVMRRDTTQLMMMGLVEETIPKKYSDGQEAVEIIEVPPEGLKEYGLNIRFTAEES